MCISMLFSARQKARMRYQESRLRPRVSWRDLHAISRTEIAPAHARSQSRLPTPRASFLTRRGKHGDIHSAWDRPLATKWQRMMICGAQAPDEAIKRYEPQRRFGPMRDKSSFSAISSPMDDPRHYVHLHVYLCASESSKAVSGVEIATSRELPQSQCNRVPANKQNRKNRLRNKTSETTELSAAQ